jgi:hypothetical protein
MLLEINFNLALFLVRLYRVTSVSGAKNGRCRLERWLKFVIQQTTFFENFNYRCPQCGQLHHIHNMSIDRVANTQIPVVPIHHQGRVAQCCLI